MLTRPEITAQVRFATTEEGGKRGSPVFGTASKYRPHIVVSDGLYGDLYQGVAFIEGPIGYRLGNTATFRLDLMYYPAHLYSDAVPGKRFTVREGGRTVAEGVVLSRDNPPQDMAVESLVAFIEEGSSAATILAFEFPDPVKQHLTELLSRYPDTTLGAAEKSDFRSSTFACHVMQLLKTRAAQRMKLDAGAP